VTVKQIHADGRIALDDGRTLPKDYRQFVRGYAVTSYAAQGKTVDYVLFSDSAVKAATNEQQWYVTISRGRKGVKIFTADKIQLRENISRRQPDAGDGHETKRISKAGNRLGARRGFRSQCSSIAARFGKAGGRNERSMKNWNAKRKLSGRRKQSSNRRP
jgi:hypothetical protein